MICQFDHSVMKWVAAGRGYTRPVVVEADTMGDAFDAYHGECEKQKGEEYALEQQMSHLSDVAEGQPYGEDLG